MYLNVNELLFFGNVYICINMIDFTALNNISYWYKFNLILINFILLNN